MRTLIKLSALAAATCVVAASAACGKGARVPPGAQAPTTGAVFGGKSCHAVRNPTEPALTAWSSEDRALITSARRQGVVAVRYSVHGCNVELEVLPNCGGEGQYLFTPAPSQKQDYIENERDLFAELPLGAASLGGKLHGNKVLRTDYTLVGVAALPIGKSYSLSDLHGPDCTRATHVVARVFLGGFAMASGDSTSLHAEASLFGIKAGGGGSSRVERVFADGDADACDRARTSGKEEPLCSVPLRIGLLELEGVQAPPAAVAPAAAPPPVESAPAPPPTPVAKAAPAPAPRPAAKPAPAPDPRHAAKATPAPTTPHATTRSARGPDMVRIPAGTFSMGSNDGESDDEEPVHRVTVASFEMDLTEVTVAQYRACVRGGKCPPAGTATKQAATKDCNAGQSGREDHPINCVDWNQASAFCAWAGKRLPTDPEWEYAARGTDGRKYPWGNAEPGPSLLNSSLAGDDGFPQTAPVGHYPAGRSPFGLHDMAGNVWEWTSSKYCVYSKNGYSSECMDSRVARGGSWDFSLEAVFRATSRYPADATEGVVDSLGFRCAR